MPCRIRRLANFGRPGASPPSLRSRPFQLSCSPHEDRRNERCGSTSWERQCPWPSAEVSCLHLGVRRLYSHVRILLRIPRYLTQLLNEVGCRLHDRTLASLTMQRSSETAHQLPRLHIQTRAAIYIADRRTSRSRFRYSKWRKQHQRALTAAVSAE